MRKIDTIIIHCSATKRGADFSAADIDRWHRQRGFQGIGYHYVIRLDGTIEAGRSIELAGAHSKGWNAHSIGICYVGGLDEKGHPADTRTDAQKWAMKELVMRLRLAYPIKEVIGHRDTSPDCNGNGRIEPQEYIKACPCFDVRRWFKDSIGITLLLLLMAGCGSHRSVSENQEKQVLQIAHNLSVDSSMCRDKVEEIDDTMEERVDRIVWQFTADTVTGRKNLSQVSRTRTERIKKRAALKQEKQGYRQKLVVADTVQMTGLTKQFQTKDTDVGNPLNWKWIFVILVILALLYYVFKVKYLMGKLEKEK